MELLTIIAAILIADFLKWSATMLLTAAVKTIRQSQDQTTQQIDE